MKIKHKHVYVDDYGNKYVGIKTKEQGSYDLTGISDNIRDGELYHSECVDNYLYDTGERADLAMMVGGLFGVAIIVYNGELYTGCTKHTAREADALLRKVGKALGWEMG